MKVISIKNCHHYINTKKQTLRILPEKKGTFHGRGHRSLKGHKITNAYIPNNRTSKYMGEKY